MYWPDILELKQFYASEIGGVAAQLIRSRSARFWPEDKGHVLLGVGYVPPFWTDQALQHNLAIACMPAPQGGLFWPNGGAGRVVLMDDALWPLHDNSISRVMIAHALENTENTRALLEEAWRVLAPGGRMLVVVPNRMGVWARSPRSPFSYGRPYSAMQLKRLMLEHDFTPLYCEGALFMPPVKRLLSLSTFTEWMGRLLCPGFAGIWLLEVEKQVYAAATQSSVVRRRIPVYAPATASVS